MIVEDKPSQLVLWDTASGEDLDRLRPLSYSATNVFLICFSIEWTESLKIVEHKYIPEILHFSRDPVPYFLIGCKKDLRFDEQLLREMQSRGERLVTEQEAQSAARRIGAHMYLECSAKTSEGVEDVFQRAASAALSRYPVRSKRKTCLIL